MDRRRAAVPGAALLLSLAGWGQACGQAPAPPDSLISQHGIGPVRLDMTEQELMDAVGEGQVERIDAYLGEGFCTPGSRVFPGSVEEIEVLWGDTSYTGIAELRISTPGSPWRTARGVGVGSTLQELEALGGAPVEFSGFGWDYGGGATWIEDGLHLRLRLEPTAESDSRAATDPRYEELLGDRIVRSDHPLARQMTIVVGTAAVSGPATIRSEFECG